MTATLPTFPETGLGTELAVVLPAYNEAKNLPTLLDRIGRALGDSGRPYRIIVVDDGSTDDTAATADWAGNSLPVEVLRHDKNRGLGAALRTGLIEAIRHSDFVITMDADDSHDPAIISHMIERAEVGYDVVIASRFEYGGAEIGVAGHRKFMSHGASALLKRVAPLKGVQDYSSGFRVYRTDLLKRLVVHYGEDALVTESGFACMVELLLKTSLHGGRVSEVPLILRYDRKKSPSKMRILRTVTRYGTVVRSHRQERSRRLRIQPLKLRLAESSEAENGEIGQRMLSVVVAGIGLILAAPLMAIIALLVKSSSRGPVLYTQTRVGIDRRGNNNLHNHRRKVDQGGLPFKIYKFRTMIQTEGKTTEQVWASPDDPRVTRVGRILRKYRLDELPQLINVLRGDMNIVGPRPEQPDIFQDLRVKVSNYQVRQRVRPGITGWAQINAHYDQSLDDVRRKVSFDLEYISRRSLAEDLKILLRTVPVVVLQRGAW